MSLSLSTFLVLPQISLVKYYETIEILVQIFSYFKLNLKHTNICINIFTVSNIFKGNLRKKTKKIESESDIFLRILSEIIIQLENGGCGGNLAQLSN